MSSCRFDSKFLKSMTLKLMPSSPPLCFLVSPAQAHALISAFVFLGSPIPGKASNPFKTSFLSWFTLRLINLTGTGRGTARRTVCTQHLHGEHNSARHYLEPCDFCASLAATKSRSDVCQAMSSCYHKSAENPSTPDTFSPFQRMSSCMLDSKFLKSMTLNLMPSSSRLCFLVPPSLGKHPTPSRLRFSVGSPFG